MYAIVESGGKQYKIKKGEVVNVEKLNKKQGETVQLDKVLMIVDKDNIEVGKPVLKNVKVILEIVKLVKGKKVVVFKYKRKKHYRKVRGHRHQYTSVKIKDIKIEK